MIEQGEESTISEVAAHLIARDVLDFNFYICDLGVVMRLYSAWRRALPRVRPFYAGEPPGQCPASLASSPARSSCVRCPTGC